MAFDPDEISNIVLDKDKKKTDTYHQAKRTSFVTKKILAKRLVDAGRVHLHSITSTFIVIGWNSRKHAVGLKPKHCSCGSDK